MKKLGILLCYNDGDLVEESICYLLETGHDLIVWDHGSDDQTASVIEQYKGQLLESKFVPREFDFYQLYQEMSRHIIAEHCRDYDWVSWPDQDEFLEGPSRAKPYEQAVEEVFQSRYDWIQFNNYNFWFTNADDPTIMETTKRVRHYSLFPDCAPRIRSWRASSTNIREFNHNPPIGERYPTMFNLRHYPARSEEQMVTRVMKDRAGLRRGTANYHYENMAQILGKFVVKPEDLHYDDGVSDLDPSPVFQWRDIYGYSPPA